MFQYTTETIINQLTDEKGKDIIKVDAVKGTLYIKGVGLFKKENVCSITKYPYQAEQKSTATVDLTSIDLTKIPDNATLRLKVETKQVGLNTSIYADAQLRHIKPFFYEYAVSNGKTISAILNAFKDAIDKEMAMTNFNFFSAEVSGNTIVLTGDDCYTQFVNVAIDFVDEDADVTVSTLGPSFTGYEDFKAVSGVTVTITDCSEGNGTVTRLIKNLRVPTNARTNPFAPDFGGFPVPGGEYDQYTIENVTERRHIGGQVVGAIDTSLTTHILFLYKGACDANDVSTAFTDMIGDLGWTIKVVPTQISTAPEQILARDKDVKDAAKSASDANTAAGQAANAAEAANTLASGKIDAAGVKELVGNATVEVSTEVDGTSYTGSGSVTFPEESNSSSEEPSIGD